MAPLIIGGLEVPWIDTVRPEDTTNMAPYVKRSHSIKTLPKGWQKAPNTKPLTADLIFEEHSEVKLRDGAIIHVDIFRPVTDKTVPATLSVTPYGKGGHGFYIYDSAPYRVGLKVEESSGLEIFESVDPDDWAVRGYATVHVEVRGTWDSEGDLYIEGTFPGIDIYDVVEDIAARDWCNGSLGMVGNSWLAAAQWSTAIQHPPSLKAIAPWEGFTDFYRDVICRGGVPKNSFSKFIFDQTIRGRQKREDLAEALERWPLMNGYWADKAVDVSDVDIPIYAVASYSSAIHTVGTIRAFNQAKSKNKWLRIHSTQEWYDISVKESNDELQAFFDRYLKGIDNKWENTPNVRVSVLTYGNRSGPQPIRNIQFPSYPSPDTDYRTLFLNKGGLSTSKGVGELSSSYQADTYGSEPVEFTHVFDEPTFLIGYPKVKLWVSSDEHDDLDIYTSLRKVSADGKVLEHVNIPWDRIPEGVNSHEEVPNTNVIK
ncbi:hypothetical protein FOXYS1_16092, partial [Fusarium oxysporum]